MTQADSFVAFCGFYRRLQYGAACHAQIEMRGNSLVGNN